MEFKDLAYSEDEEIFTIYTEHQIQLMSKGLTGGKLSQKELSYLKDKIYTNIVSLIIRIDSSGIER